MLSGEAMVLPWQTKGEVALLCLVVLAVNREQVQLVASMATIGRELNTIIHGRMVMLPDEAARVTFQKIGLLKMAMAEPMRVMAI
jgi:hypothetical protein